MHCSVDDRYFSNPEFYKEVMGIRSDTDEDSPLKLVLPDRVEGIMKEESFYCGALEAEMPSRIVLYGVTFASLLRRDVRMDFESVGSSHDTAQPGQNAKHFPFLFPRLEETGKVDQIAESIQRLSRDEIEIILDPTSSVLLEEQSKKNGLQRETNFMALAGLINFVGTNERLGRRLKVYRVIDDPVMTPTT